MRSIGQGAQWVDTDILRAAGLTVVTGGNIAALFNMLETGRFDLFSRGVNEVGQGLTSGGLPFHFLSQARSRTAFVD